MADNKNIGIKNLPQVGEIKEGDFLLVEAEAGTSILDFKDFVIGDDNTTQAARISSLQTDVSEISSRSSIKIDNVTTEPATPTSSGMIFVSAGALYFIGSSGTTTKVANA